MALHPAGWPEMNDRRSPGAGPERRAAIEPDRARADPEAGRSLREASTSPPANALNDRAKP